MKRVTPILIVVGVILALYVGSYALVSWRGHYTGPVVSEPFAYADNRTLDRVLGVFYWPVYFVDRQSVTHRDHWDDVELPDWSWPGAHADPEP